MRRRSMPADVEPGTCSSVKMSASGYSSPMASRTFSPPRIPVSQSWTMAVVMAYEPLPARDLDVDVPDSPHRRLPGELAGARQPLRRHLLPQRLVAEHLLRCPRRSTPRSTGPRAPPRRPTTSGSDDVFDVTTGVPLAIASSGGRPKPS